MCLGPLRFGNTHWARPAFCAGAANANSQEPRPSWRPNSSRTSQQCGVFIVFRCKRRGYVDFSLFYKFKLKNPPFKMMRILMVSFEWGAKMMKSWPFMGKHMFFSVELWLDPMAFGIAIELANLHPSHHHLVV